jgi:subtilisin family serine protease
MRQGSLIAIGVVAMLAATAPPAAAVNDPLRPQQWGMSMIEVDPAHQVTQGQGATVAVIDTGANFGHPDLAGRLRAGHDFIDGDDSPNDENVETDPVTGQKDYVFHGTHVAGVVAADADNGIGVEGVAPQATVLVVRVLDAEGSGDLRTVARGVDYARTHGAQVINLSLGPQMPLVGNASDLRDAIQRALDQGIVVAAAAGNDSLPFCEQPQVSGPLLCVAAVNPQGQQSFYSNFSTGSGFGIAAPGGAGPPNPEQDDIYSTSSGSGYRYLAGTSQATPHVAGVAALLVSVGLKGQAVVDRIEQTAKDAGMPGPDPIYGAGIVNARAAVAGYSLPGAGGGAPNTAGARTGSAARVVVPRVQRIRTVLRRGLVVRCLSAGTGRCSARANARRRRIAAGSRLLPIGRMLTLHARVTPRGRKLLLATLRRQRRIGAVVRVRLPGVPVQVRRVSLRP